MIPRKPMPFAGKESKREERAEKKTGKGAYARGEKMEGMHSKKGAKRGKPC